MSYRNTDPAETGTWPDPGEMETPATYPARTVSTQIERDFFLGREPRTGNAVADVLAAAFAKRGRK
jgi:hypothetical protein